MTFRAPPCKTITPYGQQSSFEKFPEPGTLNEIRR